MRNLLGLGPLLIATPMAANIGSGLAWALLGIQWQIPENSREVWKCIQHGY